MKLNKFSEFDSSEWAKIVYGNPVKYQKDLMDRGSEALSRAQRSGLMDSWMEMTPPDQHKIREEFTNLMKVSASLSDEDKKFMQESEEDHVKIFHDFLLANKKEDTYAEVYAITFEMDPITFSLKYHWNYPRPFQLGYYYGVPFYPEIASNSGSPSYPSGHTIDSYLIALLYGKKYPELAEDLLKLADKVSYTRQQSGVHYFFDAEAGKKIAKDTFALEIVKL